MNEAGIETRLVYGFLDAGKTSYIQDCVQNDFFYKRGTTLILCFEQGELAFDEEALAERNASVAYYDGAEDVTAFCTRCIEAFRPDRIYVEMNTMMQDLRAQLPACMRVTYAVTWIDWETLPLYFANFTQMINQMVSASQQVVFRGCPSKDRLEPYSQAFRLMNQRASYLRQDPMGYHEKAFDLFLPFSLNDDEIAVTGDRFVPLWLDALDHPEHYEGKRLRFTAPLELRQSEENGRWRAGRVVMACCMADLQFMAFELAADGLPGGWAILDATARSGTDERGQRKLILKPDAVRLVPPPSTSIIDLRRISQENEEAVSLRCPK